MLLKGKRVETLKEGILNTETKWINGWTKQNKKKQIERANKWMRQWTTTK